MRLLLCCLVAYTCFLVDSSLAMRRERLPFEFVWWISFIIYRKFLVFAYTLSTRTYSPLTMLFLLSSPSEKRVTVGDMSIIISVLTSSGDSDMSGLGHITLTLILPGIEPRRNLTLWERGLGSRKENLCSSFSE
jgi:hypothetical protein